METQQGKLKHCVVCDEVFETGGIRCERCRKAVIKSTAKSQFRFTKNVKTSAPLLQAFLALSLNEHEARIAALNEKRAEKERKLSDGNNT
jgi:hypothetical protein